MGLLSKIVGAVKLDRKGAMRDLKKVRAKLRSRHDELFKRIERMERRRDRAAELIARADREIEHLKEPVAK